MLGIPRRYAHFVFGIIQAGLTSATAAAIASFPFIMEGTFLKHWLESSTLSWFLMLPVVLFAAPIIRKLAVFLTREEGRLWKLQTAFAIRRGRSLRRKTNWWDNFKKSLNNSMGYQLSHGAYKYMISLTFGAPCGNATRSGDPLARIGRLPPQRNRWSRLRPDQTKNGSGWIEFLNEGLLIHGPVFRRVKGEGKKSGPARLNDKHVARLLKTTALAAGVRASGHSLRAGLATAAAVDERYTQKQPGHASATVTRRYQRLRERFRVNLTKAAGL